MGHAIGQVYQDGKLVGWSYYNGTADVLYSSIRQSLRDVCNGIDEGWRNCTCGKPPLDVILYSDYGGGFWWPAKACLECKAIIEPLMPFDQGGETLADRVPVTNGFPEGFVGWHLGHPTKAKTMKPGESQLVYRESDTEKKHPLWKVVCKEWFPSPEEVAKQEADDRDPWSVTFSIQFTDGDELVEVYVKRDRCFEYHFAEPEGSMKNQNFGTADGCWHFCDLTQWRNFRDVLESVVILGRQIVNCEDED